MTFSKKLLITALLISSSSIALAVSNTTNIEINITKDAYVNLTGTLGNNNALVDKPIAEADIISGASYNLGLLGFESNTAGTCSVTFVSDNSYKLVHTDGVTDLGDYTLTYAGFGGTVANTVGNNTFVYNAADCNEQPADLDFANTPTGTNVIAAGYYSDIVHITVTTSL